MEKTKRNQKIAVTKLDKISTKLGELDKKQKSELNLRESIYYLRHNLKRALRQGYSYQDLVQILAEQNIIISPTTLKQYLTSTIKNTRSSKRKTAANLPANSVTRKNSNQDTSLEPKSTPKKQQTSPTNQSDAKVRQTRSKDARSKSQLNKSKPSFLAGSHTDLSNEFNQY